MTGCKHHMVPAWILIHTCQIHAQLVTLKKDKIKYISYVCVPIVVKPVYLIILYVYSFDREFFFSFLITTLMTTFLTSSKKYKHHNNVTTM